MENEREKQFEKQQKQIEINLAKIDELYGVVAELSDETRFLAWQINKIKDETWLGKFLKRLK